MCQEIATILGESDVETFFSAGLFSAIDVMIGRPMEEIVKTLGLSNELAQALNGEGGRIGRVVEIVRLYNRCAWDELNNCDVPVEELRDAYVDSLRWVARARNELHAVAV